MDRIQEATRHAINGDNLYYIFDQMVEDAYSRYVRSCSRYGAQLRKPLTRNSIRANSRAAENDVVGIEKEKKATYDAIDDITSKIALPYTDANYALSSRKKFIQFAKNKLNQRASSAERGVARKLYYRMDPTPSRETARIRVNSASGRTDGYRKWIQDEKTFAEEMALKCRVESGRNRLLGKIYGDYVDRKSKEFDDCYLSTYIHRRNALENRRHKNTHQALYDDVMMNLCAYKTLQTTCYEFVLDGKWMLEHHEIAIELELEAMKYEKFIAKIATSGFCFDF